MPIVRINEFVAQPDKVVELRRFCHGVLATITASPGCLSCKLLQSQTQPERFVFVEVWEHVDDHRAAVSKIPRESMASVMPLLASAPKGEYLDVVAGEVSRDQD